MKLSVKPLLPFFILLFIVMGCSEAARREREAIKAREKVLVELNDYWKMPTIPAGEGDCIYKFSMSGVHSEILDVSPCKIMETRKIKSEEILADGRREKIKKVGFEELHIHQSGGQLEFIQLR